MPRVQTAMGEVVVFDGTNADELAAAIGAPGPPAGDGSGAITLDVPLPFGGRQPATLAPGDGLVVREAMGGFLPITADQIAEHAEQPAAEQPAAEQPAAEQPEQPAPPAEAAPAAAPAPEPAA